METKQLTPEQIMKLEDVFFKTISLIQKELGLTFSDTVLKYKTEANFISGAIQSMIVGK